MKKKLTSVVLVVNILLMLSGCKEKEEKSTGSTTETSKQTIESTTQSSQPRDSSANSSKQAEEYRYFLNTVEIDSGFEYVIFPVSVVVSTGEGQRRGSESLKEKINTSRYSKDDGVVFKNLLFYNTTSKEMKTLDASGKLLFSNIFPQKKINVIFYDVIGNDNNKDGQWDYTDVRQRYASDKKGNRFTPLHPIDEAFISAELIRSPNIFRISTIKDLNGDGKYEGWDEARYYQVVIGDTISNPERITLSPEVQRVLNLN